MVPSTNNLYFWSGFFFFFKKQKHNFLAWTGSSYNKQHLTWSLIYFVLFPPLCDRVVGLGSLCPLSYLLASHPCWVLGFTWQLRRWISVTGWDLALPQTRAGTCYLPLSVREASVLWLARKCFCCSLVSPDNSAEWRKDFSADWLFTCFTFSGFEPSEQSCFNDSQICVKVLVFSFISFLVYFSL